MAPKTLRKPVPGMQVADADGRMTPEFSRFLFDWHGILTTNQKATDATVTATTPAAVAPAPTGTHVIYRPTTSSGSGYDAPTAAYDGNPATPATAIIKDVQTFSRTWSGFAPLTGTASALVLNVIASITGVAAPARRSDVIDTPDHTPKLERTDATIDEADPAGGAFATEEYTLDAGRTWQPYDAAVTLALSQRFQDVKVRATATGTVAGARLTHKVSEIWIEVTP
jgi:hypothetical protein